MNGYQSANQQNVVKKLILTGILIAVGFVLSTFVVFPNMAPFQHMINVLAAITIGPWYGTVAAFITGAMRMATGRSILSITGGIFGAFLSGVLYRMTGKMSMAVIGEMIGTGIISAIISYPIMKYGIGLDLQHFYYYIPFFLPSSAMGSILGGVIGNRLDKMNILDKYR